MLRQELPGLAPSTAVALMAAIAAGEAPGRLPATCDAQVTLAEAVWPAEAPDRRSGLTLGLQRVGGRWDPLVAAFGINKAPHDCWVLQGSDDANGQVVRVLVRFRSDFWTELSGSAEYVLRLGAEGEHCAGTWSATVRGRPAKGVLSGTVFPVDAVEGFRRPAPGERPRLLVRRVDLPALREKAKTDWGRGWLERLVKDVNDPVAQGLAYALTGEAALAANARRRMVKALDGHEWYHIGVAHAPAFVALEHLIAYDLIHDACDDAFHRRMRRMLPDRMEHFYWGVGNSQYNPSVTSNWSLMYRSAAGLIALTLLDSRWTLPAAPPRPVLAKLSPPRDGPAGSGAWAYAGPFEQARDEDIPPDAGAWKPVPPEMIKGGVLDLAALTQRKYCRAVYLRRAVRAPETGCYRFVAGGDRKLRHVAAALGGRPLGDGEHVHLEAGEYPLAVRLWVEPVGNWEPLTFAPRLVDATPEKARQWLEAKTAEWEAEVKLAAAEKAAAEQWGLNPQAMRWLRLSAASAEGYFRRGLGEFGWNQEGEAYTRHAVRAAMPFALCYRNMLGRSIGGAERLGMMLALATAATVYSDDGAAMQSYNVGGGPMDVDLYARGWPFVPRRLRPAVLWSWNRSLALAAAGKLKDPHGVIASHDGLSAAMMMLGYPVGLAEGNPGNVMGRVTADRQKGGYVFRNRWQDGKDCVVSLFANDSQPGGTWSSAQGGTFRIDALGAAWAVRGQGYGNGGSGRALPDFSLYQNMVDVEEHFITASPQARTTCFEPQQDGSGVVSLNMDEIYLHADKEKVAGRKGQSWRLLGTKDLGIRAVRSLAVDYSGLCGSPCLVAVADRLTGTRGRNTWQMSTERENTIACEARTFLITAPNGATLKGTVLVPAGAAVRTLETEHVHEINYHGRHSRRKFLRRVVLVDGTDRDQDFLVVMTIQDGPAPGAARAMPDGGYAAGKRTIRFDGGKITVGRFAGRG